MHRHNEVKVLPYSCEQMFDLVADIENYPEFLPWCTDAHILERAEDSLIAKLVIGFGPLHETFTSRVHLQRPHRIDVEGVKGPFRHLENHWVFSPDGKNKRACSVDFEIDFAFRSIILQALMATMFGRAVDHMVESFEDRARAVYAAVPKGRRRPQPEPSVR